MTNHSDKHILIVEDSADLQILLRKLFSDEGYFVSQAFNGQQALDMLHVMATPPAFILLDIMMPVMDGFLFRQLQLKDPNLAKIPVIIMTADADPYERAKQLNIDHVFKKPIRNLDKLLEVAESLSA